MGTPRIAPISLLKKVFEVSLWATLIQDPSARRTKDSQPSGFGFEYCASHVRFRVFQQTARSCAASAVAARTIARLKACSAGEAVTAETRPVEQTIYSRQNSVVHGLQFGVYLFNERRYPSRSQWRGLKEFL